ncbi:TetR/AcrR family transcriptional regulator [Segnochrobactraceae bacterium EtOH-i3]
MTRSLPQRAPRRSRGRAEAGPAEESAGDRRMGRPPLRADPRADILAAAARLFAERGYGDSSLNDVAAAMGYSKGALYNYFSSKQEIYDAIIIDTLRGLCQATADAVDPASPAADRLRQYMMGHARFLGDNFDAFVTMLVGFSGMADAALKADALALRDAHESQLRAIIAGGVADGAFRPTEAAMVGRAVLSLLSWMARWFRPDGPKRAEDIAADYCDLLLGGLLVRD